MINKVLLFLLAEDAYRIDVEDDGEVVGLDIIDTAGQVCVLFCYVCLCISVRCLCVLCVMCVLCVTCTYSLIHYLSSSYSFFLGNLSSS